MPDLHSGGRGSIPRSSIKDKKMLGKMVKEMEDDSDYQAEKFILEILEAIAEHLQLNNMSYQTFADRINAKQKSVTSYAAEDIKWIMSGEKELSVRELVYIANALGYKLHLEWDSR